MPAAWISDQAPGPEWISAEMTSGGSIPKSIDLHLGAVTGWGERDASTRPTIRLRVTKEHRGVQLLVALALPEGGMRRPQSWRTTAAVIPPTDFEASLCL